MFRHIVAGALALALAACADRAPPPSAGPVAALSLYAIDCGAIQASDADMFADDGSFKGVSRALVDPCYLIRHPAGDLLWDAGVPELLALSPMPFKEGGFEISMKRSLSAQLKDLGLTPADIEFFSISHSHFDHVGNGNLFAGATFLIDPRERAFMFRDEARAATREFNLYKDLETAKTVEIPVDAPHDVFGDGSVEIHPAPGHTPGHRVLLVRLPQAGPVLLTGDMFHLAESREKRTVPRFNVDRAETLASMDSVEALAAATSARVVRQHVPEDFAALPAFPEPLR